MLGARMAEKSDIVEFDETGVILVRDEKLRAFVQKHAGRWRAVSAIPGILLLRQAGDEVDVPGNVLMSGEIRRQGWLVDVIGFVCNARMSGKLIVVSRDVKRELYFDNGSLRLASSTAKHDLLGEFILSEGLITKEQLEAALAELGPGRRLGQVLVDMNLLGRHDIYNLLNKKIEKVFLDAIVVREGVYYFIEDIDLTKLPASICMDTKSLLMKGLHKRDELHYYKETIPRPGSLLQRDPKALDASSGAEKDFVRNVDGKRTLAEIDQTLQLGDFETVRIARQLAEKGFIEVILDKDMEEDALRAVVNDFNTAILGVYDKVKGRVAPDELTRLGEEFIAKSLDRLVGAETVMLRSSGELDFPNVKKIYDATGEKDKMNFVIMILSRYISFILFTANSYLPQEEQEALSSRVYGKLEKYS